MEFALGEKKGNHAQNIPIAIQICIANKIHPILISPNAKICFPHMNHALIPFNANTHFIAGFQLQKKGQIILKIQQNNAYLYFLKIQRKHLDGDGQME